MISIIVPTHNNAHTIRATIESVINQDSSNWELIIVDDGSIDNSKIEIEPFIKNRSIKYFYREKEGVCSARNIGALKAKGDFLLFLDSDDLLFKNAIKDFLNVIEGQSNLGVCSGSYYNSLKKKLFPPKDKGSLFHNYHLNILSGSCILNKKVFEAVGGYDRTLTHSENWELFIRITDYCAKNNYRIIATDFPTLHYFNENILGKKQKRIQGRYDSFPHMYKKYKRLNFENKILKMFAEITAYNAFKLGKRIDACKWQWTAIKNHPVDFLALIRLFRYMFLKGSL